jgi:formyl-CoA transferase
MMQNVFPKLSRTPGSVRTLAPSIVGQHNAEILGEVLGPGGPSIEDLARRGVI